MVLGCVNDVDGVGWWFGGEWWVWHVMNKSLVEVRKTIENELKLTDNKLSTIKLQTCNHTDPCSPPRVFCREVDIQERDSTTPHSSGLCLSSYHTCMLLCCLLLTWTHPEKCFEFDSILFYGYLFLSPCIDKEPLKDERFEAQQPCRFEEELA